MTLQYHSLLSSLLFDLLTRNQLLDLTIRGARSSHGNPATLLSALDLVTSESRVEVNVP